MGAIIFRNRTGRSSGVVRLVECRVFGVAAAVRCPSVIIDGLLSVRPPGSGQCQD